MKYIMMIPKKLLSFTAALCVGAVALAAGPEKPAVEVPAESAVSSSSVRGMTMEFYDFNPNVPKGLDSLEEAIIYAAASQPDALAVLNVPAIDFPKERPSIAALQISLGDYFFGKEGFAARKAQGMTLSPRMSEAIGERSVFVFRGFVEVEKAGTYKIRVPVDDGAEVKIGGVVVYAKNDFGGITSYEDPVYAARVKFMKPGIYPLRVTHWDREKDLGIHIFWGLEEPGKAAPAGNVLLPILTTKSGEK